MSRSGKTLLIVGALAITAGLCLGCEEIEAQPMDQEIVVSASQPELGQLVLEGQFIGTVAADQQVSVIPLVAAEIEEVLVEVGDEVKAGAVLARLDDEAARIQLASATAAYNSAQKSAAQSTGASWDLQVMAAEANVSQIEAAIRQYESQIKQTKAAQDDVEDQLTDVRRSRYQMEDNGTASGAQLASAQSKYERAAAAYATALSLNAQLRPTLEELDIKTQAQLLAMAGLTEDAEPPFEPDSSLEPQAVAAREIYTALYEGGLTVEELSESNLTLLKATADSRQNTVAALSGNFSSSASGASSLQSAEAQLESAITSYANAIKQCEDAIVTYQENLEAAQASLELTRGQLREETDAVLQSQVDAAAVGVSSARMALDYYTLTTPISGTITAVNVEKYGLAAQGYAAFTIANLDAMKVSFLVSELVRGSIAVGDPVSATRNGHTYEGTIIEVGNAADPMSGLFLAEALIQANGAQLLAGTRLTLTLNTQRSPEDSLLIPYDAIYFQEGQAYVFCLREGRAQRVFIGLGLYDEDMAVAESGLTADDLVVTSWSPRLRDGVPARLSADGK